VDDFLRFDLQSRTALVTGAARGLGNAIALALAHAGADVALGLRDPATGADLADQIEGMGRRALRLQMDVRDLDQVRAAVTATVGESAGSTSCRTTRASAPPIRPRTSLRPTST
jgi:NAD(P)-dependent dehydrogenase (short-subunit alcohol dehydrogenase family)